MTEYCIMGTAEPFKTNYDFFQAVRKQAFGKSDASFYNINYPLSYFNFSWYGGKLVLNFYNTRTNREEHKYLKNKNLSYSVFTELLEGPISYLPSGLYEDPIVWSPKKKNIYSVGLDCNLVYNQV